MEATREMMPKNLPRPCRPEMVWSSDILRWGQAMAPRHRSIAWWCLMGHDISKKTCVSTFLLNNGCDKLFEFKQITSVLLQLCNEVGWDFSLAPTAAKAESRFARGALPLSVWESRACALCPELGPQSVERRKGEPLDVHDCVRVGVCNCQSNYQYYVPLLLATACSPSKLCSLLKLNTLNTHAANTVWRFVKGDVQANEMVTWSDLEGMEKQDDAGANLLKFQNSLGSAFRTSGPEPEPCRQDMTRQNLANQQPSTTEFISCDLCLDGVS